MNEIAEILKSIDRKIKYWIIVYVLFWSVISTLLHIAIQKMIKP